MVDPDRVAGRLARLDGLVDRLERVRARDEATYLTDVGLRLETERALQLALQITIDVGAHLVAEIGAHPPDRYRDVFRALAEAGILDAELAGRMEDAAGLRNLLVHGYAELDDRQVRAALERIEDLRAFAVAAQRAARER